MDIKRILKAAAFAAEKHRNQRRKNKSAMPYINHPINVAELIVRVGNVDDEDLIIAALLHDTIEDTETTKEEIEANFGVDVASLVLEVTDDKTLPSPERKRLQIVSAPAKSLRAKQLKLADKVSNLSVLADDPPVDWSVNRQIKYMEWAKKVVDGLRGSNSPLERRFDHVYKEGLNKLRAQKMREDSRGETGSCSG